MISDSHTTAISTSSYLSLIANLLATIGAINWGLVGAFRFDLVAFLFGEMSTLSRIVYGLVGLAGVYFVVTLGKRFANN